VEFDVKKALIQQSHCLTACLTKCNEKSRGKPHCLGSLRCAFRIIRTTFDGGRLSKRFNDGWLAPLVHYIVFIPMYSFVTRRNSSYTGMYFIRVSDDCDIPDRPYRLDHIFLKASHIQETRFRYRIRAKIITFIGHSRGLKLSLLKQD